MASSEPAGSLELRRLRADEGLAYRAVRLRALEREPAAYGQTLAEALADPEQTWHDLATSVAADDPRALFVVDRGDGVLGGTLYAALSEVPPHLGTLGAMWVDEDLRAQGCADALMETAIDWAVRWGAAGLSLWVATDNERAQRLYARHGFAPTGNIERWEADGAARAAQEWYCAL
ncbi:MAG: GNAT family N-acetyltransferase [Chloroflexota bacterium]